MLSKNKGLTAINTAKNPELCTKPKPSGLRSILCEIVSMWTDAYVKVCPYEETCFGYSNLSAQPSEYVDSFSVYLQWNSPPLKVSLPPSSKRY
jgi:hypothetical protein